MKYAFPFSHSILFGFLIGVAIISFVPIPIHAVAFLSVFIIAAVAILFIADRSPPTQIALFILIGFLACFFGIIRYSSFRRNEGDAVLDSQNEKSVTLRGIITEEPYAVGDAQRSILSLDRKNESVSILLKSDLYPQLEYGDRVSVSGTIKKPEPFETENGRVFNYPAFLAKDKIFYTMSRSKVSIKEKHQASFLKEKLLVVKHSFIDHISSVIPKPESDLLGGYLVEGKQSLSKNLQEEFKTAGVIHTVALSGFNVTVIIQAVMQLLRFLPFYGQLAGGAVSIVLFAIMTGASASVVRAVIMALVAILGKSTARTYDVARALFAAAFFMVLWNPMLLMFDPGFQLSFLATLGLIYTSPVIAPYLLWIPEKLKLRETITSTLAAQITVLPFILYSSGQLSIVALPANVLMLPGIPLTMLLGTITAGFSFVSYYLALPIGWLTYIILHLQLGLIHFLSNVPYAAVQVPFPLWLMALSYAFMIFWLFYNFPRLRPS